MAVDQKNIDLSSFPISINDVKDDYFDGKELSKDEKTAIVKFDKYRIDYLNNSTNDAEFEKRYIEIQAIANLESFHYFLEPENLAF